MKLSRLSLVVLGAALLFSTGAFAQDQNQGKLSIAQAVTVDGKQLPAGDYKLQWEGAGPNVELKILKNKETVATVPARIVTEPNKSSVNSYGTTQQQDGSRALTAINFGGKNYSLEIAVNSAQATPAAGSPAQ